MYRTDLIKYGAAAMIDEEICKAAKVVSDASELTAYESHLVRSFKKPKDQIQESVVKYAALFAKVDVASVQKCLRDETAAVLAKAESAAAATPTKAKVELQQKAKK